MQNDLPQTGTGLVDSIDLVLSMMRYHLLHASPWGAHALEILEQVKKRLQAPGICTQCGNAMAHIVSEKLTATLCPRCDAYRIYAVEDDSGLLEDDLPL